jgi:hypothetical protein
MFRLSWSTFRERWALFVGAALTVCLGVALVQSSLLVLISAATLDVPRGLSAADRMRFAEGTEVAITLAALTLAFSAFAIGPGSDPVGTSASTTTSSTMATRTLSSVPSSRYQSVGRFSSRRSTDSGVIV